MREKITKTDIKKIKEEIDHRRTVVRSQCLEAVKEARAHGDLSENFEYHAAKRDKNQNESRIRYLENLLRHAVIVSDEAKEGEVGLNTKVTVYIEDDDEEETYKLVTSIRGNSVNRMISTESPLGKALIYHKPGDRVEVFVNEKISYFVTIRSIERAGDEEDRIRKF